MTGVQTCALPIYRNLKSFLMAIVGAEYVLGLLPKGTHEYERFIRPSELARWTRAAELELGSFAGLAYEPLTRRFRVSTDTGVNYLAHFTKPVAGSPP